MAAGALSQTVMKVQFQPFVEHMGRRSNVFGSWFIQHLDKNFFLFLFIIMLCLDVRETSYAYGYSETDDSVDSVASFADWLVRRIAERAIFMRFFKKRHSCLNIRLTV